MTREEQMKKALCESLPEGTYSERELLLACSGFKTGAKWADKNPHWHKYPAEKPEKEDNSEWSETVLITIKGLNTPVKAQLHFPQDIKDCIGIISTELVFSRT